MKVQGTVHLYATLHPKVSTSKQQDSQSDLSKSRLFLSGLCSACRKSRIFTLLPAPPPAPAPASPPQQQPGPFISASCSGYVYVNHVKNDTRRIVRKTMSARMRLLYCTDFGKRLMAPRFMKLPRTGLEVRRASFRTHMLIVGRRRTAMSTVWALVV